MKRVLLAFPLILGLAAPAAAQDPAAFFAGKTVRIIVGVGVGSGYDINARLLARHIGRHIPGNPTVIVQNQPGAGSQTMTNTLYSSGPFDGTAIGASFNGLPTLPLLQPGGARFDPNRLVYVGSTNRETQVSYVWHTAPTRSADDLGKVETVIGAQAPGSTQYDYPTLSNALFGHKYKVITGYESTPKIHLAMESGEVHGTWANWSTLKAIGGKWLEEKKVRLLLLWGLEPNPELKGLPMAMDLARTDADKAAMRLMVARLEYGRPFFLPPGVPADRVQALRRAFDATMKDPAYLEEAKRLKIEVDALTGEKVNELVAQVTATPKDVVERVRKGLEKK